MAWNNRKECASIYNDVKYRIRDDIPLYQGAQNEVIASIQAEMIGTPKIVPKTVMAIIKSNRFYDLTDKIPTYYDRMDYGIIKEKLCSIQAFVPEAKELHEILSEPGSEDFISKLDQDNFEDANILTWVTYDTDGHAGNYLVYPLNGESKFGLKKIDSGLSNPDKNQCLSNCLATLPQAELPFSERGKNLIAQIPEQPIAEKMREIGKSEESVQAFLQRVKILKEIAKQDNVTLAEIQQRMERIQEGI